MSGARARRLDKTIEVTRVNDVVTLTFQCRDAYEAIRLHDEITGGADTGELVIQLASRDS